MEFDRRFMLKSLGMGAGAFVVSNWAMPRRARAAGADRNFIFAYFQGGWDITLGIDPRDPNVYTADRVGETKVELAWDRLGPAYTPTLQQAPGSNIALGPAAAAIASHFDVMCVVRGVSMDTVTH